MMFCKRCGARIAEPVPGEYRHVLPTLDDNHQAVPQ